MNLPGPFPEVRLRERAPLGGRSAHTSAAASVFPLGKACRPASVAARAMSHQDRGCHTPTVSSPSAGPCDTADALPTKGLTAEPEWG